MGLSPSPVNHYHAATDLSQIEQTPDDHRFRRADDIADAEHSTRSHSEGDSEIVSRGGRSDETRSVGSFSMLADSSDEKPVDSAERPENFPSDSESSGVTIYTDAVFIADSSNDERSRTASLDHLRDHVNSSVEGVGYSQGLVSVRPIQSRYRLSQALSEHFDFEDSGGDHNAFAKYLQSSTRFQPSSRSPPSVSAPSVVTPAISRTVTPAISRDLTPTLSRTMARSNAATSHSAAVYPTLEQDEGRASNVISPVTPRSRTRSALRPLSGSQLNTKRATELSNFGGSPVAPSDLQKRINRKRTIPPGAGINIILGKPRKPSPSGSEGAHSQRTVSSDGHLVPERRVNAARMSFIRRAGATTRTNNAFFVGFPRLPQFPGAQTPLRHEERAGLVTPLNSGDVERDLWGRRIAGKLRSWMLLLFFTCFPPLWLFLSFGYFDPVCGTVDRTVKITALFLTALTFVAGTALVIVFSVLRW